MHVPTRQLSSDYEGLEHLLRFPDSQSLCLVISEPLCVLVSSICFERNGSSSVRYNRTMSREQKAEKKNHRLPVNMYRTISASDQTLAVGNHPPDCSFLLPPPAAAAHGCLFSRQLISNEPNHTDWQGRADTPGISPLTALFFVCFFSPSVFNL